jgi:hypothetical protein
MPLSSAGHIVLHTLMVSCHHRALPSDLDGILVHLHPRRRASVRIGIVAHLSDPT